MFLHRSNAWCHNNLRETFFARFFLCCFQYKNLIYLRRTVFFSSFIYCRFKRTQPDFGVIIGIEIHLMYSVVSSRFRTVTNSLVFVEKAIIMIKNGDHWRLFCWFKCFLLFGEFITLHYQPPEFVNKFWMATTLTWNSQSNCEKSRCCSPLMS